MMYKIQQPARTHCATEHLATGRRGHPLQLMVQCSWIQAHEHSILYTLFIPKH